ncbi:MAG: CHRD domain-containing protein [Candidatus Rokubacteria bacterium]|nr:CHRD domain-containing protein [Candidatus Rokubacteria bacterium]
MKKALAVAAIALGLVGTHGTTEASTLFHATMTFDQEVPTVPAFEGASGSATFVLNDARNALSYDVLITGLDFPPSSPAGPTDMTRLHIHRGPAGVAGPIVFGMIETATPPPIPQSDLDDLVISASPGLIHVTGVWDGLEGNAGATLAGELGNLFSGNLYINAHTGDHAPGEIRGLIAVPAPAGLLLIVVGIAGAGSLALRRRIA